MSEFNQYYQDELSYLRDMGAEFARYYPKLAPFLASQGSDPDVERLLEGFAFLSARVRQKLDDEFPELTEGLFSLLWPDYLQPIPSCSILQFDPIKSAVNEQKRIPPGTEVEGKAIDGTRCRFRTVYPVNILPLEIADLRLESGAAHAQLQVLLEPYGELVSAEIKIDNLRFYIAGDLNNSLQLYHEFNHSLQEISFTALDANKIPQRSMTLPMGSLHFLGFDEQESLMPSGKNADNAYTLLKDYHILPEKFMFFEIKGLSDLLHEPDCGFFQLTFKFNSSRLQNLTVSKQSLRLHCTPIINLFHKDASPVRFDHSKTDYRLIPQDRKPQHYEIVAVNSVTSWVQGTNQRKNYQAFISFANTMHQADQRNYHFYRLKRIPATVGSGLDTYIRFVNSDSESIQLDKEVVSVSLLCSNRNIAEKLKEGDVVIPTGTTPEYVTFQNITPLSRSYPPPVSKDLAWLLISSMSINYRSLVSLDSIRQIVSLYNIPAFYNVQHARINEVRLQSLLEISQRPVTAVLAGAPCRGIRIYLKVSGSKFSNSGEMLLFLQILNMFFKQQVSINSFSELWVEDVDSGECYQWNRQSGNKSLL